MQSPFSALPSLPQGHTDHHTLPPPPTAMSLTRKGHPLPQAMVSQTEPEPAKKKRRTPLSCVTCRHKKIKCDRSKPKCNRCINSNIKCVYDSPVMWSDISEENLNLGGAKTAKSAITFVSSLGHSCNTTTTTTTTTTTMSMSTSTSAANTPHQQTPQQQQQNHPHHHHHHHHQHPLAQIPHPIAPNINNIAIPGSATTSIIKPIPISIASRSATHTTLKSSQIFNQSILNFDSPSFHHNQNNTLHSHSLSNINSIAALNNTNAVNIPPIQNAAISVRNIPLPASLVDRVSEIEYLRKRIWTLQHSFDHSLECMSLVLDDDDKPLVIFRSKKDSRFMCLGTFINSGTWKRDPLMNSFFKIFFSMKRRKKVGKSKKNSKDLVNKKNKLNLIHKYYLHGGASDTKPNSIPPLRLFEFLNNQLMTKKTKVKMVDNAYFVQQIEQLLPPWDVIQFHIDRFMKYIYPFIPVIDEQIFRLNISKILAYPTVNEIADSLTGVKVILNEKSDALRLSLLLLIMRLSYLSVYLEIDMTNQKASIPQQRILSYPIGSNAMNLVQFSLQNTNFLRKTSVETFQVLVLYRFYQLKGCEDGDGYLGSDGTTFQGLIRATAKNIGLDQQFDENIIVKLNKKQKINENGQPQFTNTPASLVNSVKVIPDEHPDLNKFISPDLQSNLLMRGPVTFNQLWKKLWWTSLNLDLHHGMTYGSTPQFDHDPEKSRTGNPIFNPEFSNAQNLEIERFTIDTLKQFSNFNFPVYELLEMLHSFKHKPAVIQVEAKMEEIMRLTEMTFDNSNCGRYVSPSLFVSSKVNNIKSKLEVYSCLLVIQYNLLLHCEKLGIKEKTGYRSESLGFANERFANLFPKIFSNWIFIIESTILVWQKLCGYGITTTDSEISTENIESESAEFSPYIILIAPIINIIFAKLMSLLFYISVRLFIFHYQVKDKKNNVEMSPENIEKMDELLKLYHHLITLFKTLVVMEAKLSKYWYPSLRLYTMFRKCFEWFEGGEKFMPSSFTYPPTETTPTPGSSDDNNPSSTICIIANDTNAQDSASIIQQFLFYIDISIIKEINMKIEKLESAHGLEKINSTYDNVFPKADANTDQNEANNNQYFDLATPTGTMMENVVGSSYSDEFKTEKSTPDSTKSTSAVGDNINFLESLEMDDWDDISKWFNQTPVLDMDPEAFRREFRQFM